MNTYQIITAVAAATTMALIVSTLVNTTRMWFDKNQAKGLKKARQVSENSQQKNGRRHPKTCSKKGSGVHLHTIGDDYETGGFPFLRYLIFLF